MSERDEQAETKLTMADINSQRSAHFAKQTYTGKNNAPTEPAETREEQVRSSDCSATWLLEEWLAEAERRFGQDQLKWRFKCPGCGHEQAVEDFRPYKDKGATAESARFNCIGRYAGVKRRAFGGEGGGPCDYTSGGLLDIRPWTVRFPDGTEIKTFAFAESLNDEAERQAGKERRS